ncbi:nuclear transport factor 2 family protein [Phaeobacter marinintestinus]|uniref:nuclear transport factor 2 family protein n=1 Tax=Falsiphaeobacter marinintestinus TaxID=1492905 RepID=UPI0011B39E8C|nr:nuclear transport factor 2 family protein [Phaeobacter marinintestinus]
MTDCIHTLFSAWGDPSPDGRASKTDAAIGPDFYYADPNAADPVEGRDAYLAYIAQFSDMMPGASAKVVSVSQHHGHARATVDFLKGDTLMMRGQYFADINDAKITRLIGFTGTGDTE